MLIILALWSALPVAAQRGSGGITMTLNNTPLATALRKVQQKSDYKVSFVVDDVRPYTVSVTLRGATAPEAVREMLRGKPFACTVSGEFITVKKTKAGGDTPDDASPGSARQQPEATTRRLSGRVIEAGGEPLFGVSVTVPGSPLAAMTDRNGEFFIYIPRDCQTVQVSCIGMKTQDVRVAGKANVRVVMSENNWSLGEVLVTGYQTLSRERATGSFAKVTADDLRAKRLSDLQTVLAGEVAGYNDGRLRGVTTMIASTTPLYVVDGFLVEKTTLTGSGGDIAEGPPDINMDDIESITVLKDAAAASIYGARAANGVIVITTKKAAARGKTSVAFNASLTWHPEKTYTGHLADSRLVVDLEREWAAQNQYLSADGAKTYARNMLADNIYTSAGIRSILNYHAGNITESEMNSTLNALAAKGYHYYDQVTKYARRNPVYQQYNVNITSSSASNVFKASTTYKHDTNADLYASDQSLGINLSNTTTFSPRLSLDLGAYVKAGEEQTQDYSALSPGYSILPYDDLVGDDGTCYTKPMSERLGASDLDIYSRYRLYDMDITPMDEMSRRRTTNKQLALRTYARLNIRLLPWLKYAASMQYERASIRGEQISKAESAYVRGYVNAFAVDDGTGNASYVIPYGDMLFRTDQYTSAYNFRQQIDFNKTLGGRHSLTAIMGTETIQNRQELHTNRLFNYDAQMLTSTQVDQAALVDGVAGVLGYNSVYDYFLGRSFENVNRFVSVYANAGYTCDERYTATASLRWDRSNLWGTSSKYQNKPLWSVGASWIVSRERWFRTEWIDFLKLRLSDGIGGNVSKDSAPYMVANYYSNTHVGGQYGYIVARANPLLSWEKTNTLNLGIEYALLRNRLRGSIEYYSKSGHDLLASSVGVPTEGWGYSTYTINNGEMYNRGIELSVAADIVRSRDLSWTASLKYAYNKNRVTYVNVKAPVYYLQLDYPTAYPVVGHEYNAIYAYRWAGLSADGLPQVYDEQGDIVQHQPTSLDAIHYAGTTSPKYSGSLSTTIAYRDFDLSLQLLFAGGHKMRNANPAFLQCSYASPMGYISNIAGASAALANRWQKPGDELNTSVPRAVFAESGLSASDLYSVYYYADINILDASHLRLNNVALAYHLPSALCQRLRMQAARVQVNVENPVMWARSRQAKYQLGGYNATNYVVGVSLNF